MKSPGHMAELGIHWQKYVAIIFDFDGVIGRTMEDNYRAWKRAFADHGLSLEKKEYLLLEGLSSKGVAEAILRKLGIGLEAVSDLAARKERYYLADHAFSFYPDVEALIGTLRSEYRLGLVSGAADVRLKRTVLASFLEKFHVVITADDVRRPKPDPEPYRTACERLKINPGQALAIENAPLGIEAAKRAGLDCVGICSTLDPRHLVRADIRMGNISELYRAFAGRI